MKKSFIYYTARLIISQKYKHKSCLLDIEENFETKDDAEDWLADKINNANNLKITDEAYFFVKSEVMEKSIEYVSEDLEQERKTKNFRYEPPIPGL